MAAQLRYVIMQVFLSVFFLWGTMHGSCIGVFGFASFERPLTAVRFRLQGSLGSGFRV